MMSDFPAKLKGSKRWTLILEPYPINNCDDNTLNHFIDEHTREEGVLTWASMKTKKCEFNAKASKIKVIYVGYCVRCHEYWKINNPSGKASVKSKCVQRKFILNDSRSHIAIYETTNDCVGKQISSDYIPKRGFKISDKVSINQAYAVGGNSKIIANNLTSQGIDRKVVNNRLGNLAKSLKVSHSIARKKSLSNVIEMINEVKINHNQIFDPPNHPFSNDQCHPLHGLFIIDHDLDIKGSDWTFVMFVPTSINVTIEGLSKMHEGRKSVQIQLDFTTDVFPNDNKQLGTIYCNDCLHQVFPLLFVICNAECKNSCVAVISTIQAILNLKNIKIRQVLADRGTAIMNALVELMILFVGCYTHSLRRGNTRGGGYRGGEGSATRYLVQLVSVHI